MALFEPVQFAKIDTASSGDTSLVAATTGKKVKVVGFFLIASGAVSVKLRSGTTDLTGAMAVGANGGLVVQGGPAGEHVIETAAGSALNINLSAATQVSGAVRYVVEA